MKTVIDGKYVALDVDCLHDGCPAKAGEVCRVPSGAEAQHSHLAREKASKAKAAMNTPAEVDSHTMRVERTGPSSVTVWIERKYTEVSIKHID